MVVFSFDFLDPRADLPLCLFLDLLLSIFQILIDKPDQIVHNFLIGCEFVFF